MEPLKGSVDRYDRQTGTRLLRDDEIESMIAEVEEQRASKAKKAKSNSKEDRDEDDE